MLHHKLLPPIQGCVISFFVPAQTFALADARILRVERLFVMMVMILALLLLS